MAAVDESRILVVLVPNPVGELHRREPEALKLTRDRLCEGRLGRLLVGGDAPVDPADREPEAVTPLAQRYAALAVRDLLGGDQEADPIELVHGALIGKAGSQPARDDPRLGQQMLRVQARLGT